MDAANAPPEVRRRVGYVSQEFKTFEHMTVSHCLRLVSGFYDRSDHAFVDRLCAEWGLLEQHLAQLSVGQRQKVAILLALGHRPDLLVLDEPVASLDPATRRDFLSTVVGLNADFGQTVLLSSHITSDIERIATHVAILQRSRIACQMTMDDLKDRVRRVTFADGVIPADALARSGNAAWLLDTDGEYAGAAVEPLVLEDFFLALTA